MENVNNASTAMMSANESGSALRRVTAILDIHVDEFASLIGADPAVVVHWTSGKASPSADVGSILAELLPKLDMMERVRAELETVHKLVDALTQKIQHLSNFDIQDVLATHAAGRNVFGPSPQAPVASGRNHQRVLDYKLLLDQAWGRVVRVRQVETNTEYIYRIAWGAESWGDLRIWCRNGPTVSKLMSARRGQIIDLGREENSREYEVLEVSLLTRHAPGSLRGNYSNFERIQYALDRVGHPREVAEELEAWLEQARETLRDSLAIGEVIAVSEPEILTPLTPESKAGLSDRFFMDPLEAQEEVMTWPQDGYAIVEGIAGSGKTSVALGRAAHLCMQRDDQRVLEFTPASGVGYVLSEQLVNYLETLLKGNLNLEKMPVKSFFRLRQELLGARKILSTGVKRVNAENEKGEPAIGASAWADVAEEAMAPEVLRALLAALPVSPKAALQKPSAGITQAHWDAISGPWDEFRRALPKAFGTRIANSLQGSLERIDRARGEFAYKFEHMQPWNSPRFKDDRRKVNQQIRDAIIAAYDYAARYFEAAATGAFEDQLRKRFSHSSGYAGILNTTITAARERAKARTLANWDIDCLLLIAHRAAIGYRGRDGAQPIEHLRETDYRTHVFIDEVQDFTEIQVRLMAAQADPKFRCVTAVGDFSQRLSTFGIESLERSGLASARTMFLGFNKRQTAPLHKLAHDYRKSIQGELRPCEGEAPTKYDERPFLLSATAEAAVGALRNALMSTRAENPSFSMAVLCRTDARARALEASLHDDLWERNILSRVSGRAEAAKLCDAFHVHFTTPFEAKGLEFDAVFVIDTDEYDMNAATDQAALYVALSRARRRLGVAYQKAPHGKLGELFGLHLSAHI